MFIERNDSGEHRTVTFLTRDEVLAVGVSFLMLQYHENDTRLEIGAYMGLLAYEGKTISRETGVYSLSTERLHEGIILAGLLWVAREKERITSDMFAREVATVGLDETLSKMDQIALGAHMEEMDRIAEELREDEVISNIFRTRYP